MINHARTLLMNRRPGSLQAPGEEFIPDEFQPITPTPALANLYAVLFGTTPDRNFLNFRLDQFLTLLHSTELVDFVTDLDPRITYWPSNNQTFFNDTLFENFVIQLDGGSIATLYLYGSAIPDETHGRINEVWSVRLTDGDTVIVDRLDTAGVQSLEVPKGFDQMIQLPGSGLRIYIQLSSIALPPPPGTNFRLFGKVNSRIDRFDRAMYLTPPYSRPFILTTTAAAWLIESVARPTSGLTAILQQLSSAVTEQTIADVFGRIPVDPFTTFLRLWEDHPQMPYKLGGLLLGMAYRMNLLRR